MVLFRPVGTKELLLIEESAYKRFPPRLPELYAEEIALKWNVRYNDDHRGYVVAFEVEDEFCGKYEPHTVGNEYHKELWVPAEELDEFNDHIVGMIRVIKEFSEN